MKFLHRLKYIVRRTGGFSAPLDPTKRLVLTGFSDGDAFGSPTLSGGPVTLALTGFSDSDSFGTIEFVPGEVDLNLTGFANTNNFGTTSLQEDLSLTGFANTNNFGTIELDLNLDLTGFVNDNNFGSITLEEVLVLSGFANSNRFGNHTFDPGAVDLDLVGVDDTTDNFGNIELVQNISLSGISSTNSFGGLVLEQNIILPGFKSDNTFGSLELRYDLDLVGFENENAFGDGSRIHAWVPGIHDVIRVPVDRSIIRAKDGDDLLVRDLSGSITGGGVANKTPIVVDYLQSKIVIGDKLPVE